jgi:acetyltransferase-like isoleucine patch superfamily enzyme
VKRLLARRFPSGSFFRWLLSLVRSDPTRALACLCRSLSATRKLTGHYHPTRVRVGPGARLCVSCCRSARVEVKGIIHCERWIGNALPSSLSCGERATLKISGDFGIGPGVHIKVGREAVLEIGGRKDSVASGFTSNGLLMVEESVQIGTDCVFGPDVFISDSDWHNIVGVERREPVVIGDHVWLSHGVSVMKGASIPSGCIVGAKSAVVAGSFPADSLLAGNPATVRRTNVEWTW